jgi:hypothetical protein
VTWWLLASSRRFRPRHHEPAFAVDEERRSEAKTAHDFIERVGKVARRTTACGADGRGQGMHEEMSGCMAMGLRHDAGAPTAEVQRREQFEGEAGEGG